MEFRAALHGHARSADGNTITGSSDISEDGSTWAPDLQITYKRVR
jgi:hypothetical protein